jgi:hypothetical protein
MTEIEIPSHKIPSKYKFRVKCTCNAKFGLQFELRKKYRKRVNLHGTLLKPGQNLKWGKTLSESQETRIKKTNCQITNISMGGVGITILDIVEVEEIQEGDILLVKFTLDNSASTEMEKKVIVRVVKGVYIGCEFFEADKNDTTLKFYFL